MERTEGYPQVPLGKWPKKVEISAEEMHLASLHREATGEPIQTWIRRMIRERWEINENMKCARTVGSADPGVGISASTVGCKYSDSRGGGDWMVSEESELGGLLERDVPQILRYRQAASTLLRGSVQTTLCFLDYCNGVCLQDVR